jgi:hypothetical protein
MVVNKYLERMWKEVVLSWNLLKGTEKSAKKLSVIIAKI